MDGLGVGPVRLHAAEHRLISCDLSPVLLRTQYTTLTSPTDEHLNRTGTVHGGVAATLPTWRWARRSGAAPGRARSPPRAS
jgi:hypothetical protein